MSRFRNVLLVQTPGGGSTEALERAAEIARREEARLKLFSAPGPAPRYPRLTVPGTALGAEELVLTDHRERLEALAEPLRRDGLWVETVVRSGTPFLEIIREVMTHDHDLVIKTAEGADGRRERLFGTTALHLMRKCPCPVWVVKPTGRERVARVVAAVDPSPEDAVPAPDDDHFRVNDTILSHAIPLARSEDCELVIAHAWSVYGESLLRSRGQLPEAELEKLARQTRRLHEEQLGHLLAGHDLSGVSYDVRLVRGDASDAVPALVEECHADLVVMGSVGRSGRAGVLIGNTADQVLGRLNCSVLIVKPEGFVSPVVVPERREAALA